MTEADYVPVWTKNPNAYSDQPECFRRAVSLFTSKELALEVLLLPSHNGECLGLLALPPGAGVVQPGRTRKKHIHWWRCGAFDAVAHTSPVD